MPSLEGREVPNVSLEHREDFRSGHECCARARVENEGYRGYRGYKINRPPLIIYASMSRCFVNVYKYVTSSVDRWSFRGEAGRGGGGQKEEVEGRGGRGGGAETLRRLVLSNENLGRSR